MNSTKTEIGPSITHIDPDPGEGYSKWIENGVWYKGETVDTESFGPHRYGGYSGRARFMLGDCECGCSMAQSSSRGPFDPFGACPMNPKEGKA